MTDRHPQWEARLAAFVAANLDRPHEYGRFDSLLMPAAAVKAVTGVDHGRGHRGKYRSFAGAYRYLGTLGFRSHEEILDSLFDEKPVAFAGRGDLVLCDLSRLVDPSLSDAAPVPGGEHAVPGLCMGTFALCLAGEHPATGSRQGMVQVPRPLWLKAWAVGDHHSGKLKLRRRRRKAK
jgi:hypothetical protein